MPQPHDILLMLIVVIAVGILAQVVSGLTRLPSIVFLLSFGVILGPSFWKLITGLEGIGFIRPDELGVMLQVIVELSVVLILFEGSMNLRVRELRQVQFSVRRLCTIGIVLTCGGAATAAMFICGLEFKHALIFGALVSVTGPTVIKPLIARIKVRREIKTILEGEGILADPIGALLAIIALQFALGDSGTLWAVLHGFGTRLAIGVAVGIAMGTILGLTVRFRVSYSDRLKNLIALALVFASFALAESFMVNSGLTAVVVAGLFAQLGIGPHEHELRVFKEQLSILVLSILFVLLAANLDLQKMLDLGWRGLLTVGIVMLFIRPLNILLSTFGGKPTFREKIFLAWTAPRGIVAASVASLSALVLVQHGQPDGSRIESLVFLTIFLTVFLQAGLAKPVALILGITKGHVGPILIIGANSVGIALANLLDRMGRDVVVVDKNRNSCRAARKLGLEAVHGDALDRDMMVKDAELAEADALLAMTPNVEVNQLIGQMASQEYEIDNVHIADTNLDSPPNADAFARFGGGMAFGTTVSISHWDELVRAGNTELVEVDLAHSEFGGRSPTDLPLTDDIVPLVYSDSEGAHIVDHRFKIPTSGKLFLLVRKDQAETVTRMVRVEEPSTES
jgi:NhaP-type Na+/H+ or K+/H+ antiporter